MKPDSCLLQNINLISCACSANVSLSAKVSYSTFKYLELNADDASPLDLINMRCEGCTL